MSAMHARRTWQDLEREALNDPLIDYAVTMVRAGQLSREDALIAATLGMAAVNRELVDQIVRLKARGPA